MSQVNLPSQLLFHGNGGTFPPHGIITSTDRGPNVVVTTWIMMSLMVLSISARFGTRLNLGGDSVAAFVAMVLAISESVVIHLSVNHGLGRHQASLSYEDYNAYTKSIYASQLLKILILYLAKVSLILVFIRVIPSKPKRRIFESLLAFVTLWGVAAMIALAVQCETPNPWNLTATRCVNQGALYYTNGAINVVTDALIIISPAIIVWDISIKRKEKRNIIFIFATRLVVCAFSIVELVSFKHYLHSPDQTWFNTYPNIWGQIVINLSIITACIPMMRPFFGMLQFSLIDAALPYTSTANMYQLGSREYPPRSQKP